MNLQELEVDSSECPGCGADTCSLKAFEFPQVVFLVFAHSHRVDQVTACPSCLRRYLYMWSAKSLVTANLLWPVIILPLFVSRFIASFLHGPSVGKKSLIQKIAGVPIGILLVISGFALLFGVFGLVTQNSVTFFAVATIPVIIFGFLGAIVRL